MITFCLLILLVLAIYTFFMGVFHLFGGEGLSGLAVALFLIPIGIVVIICDVIAIFQLYNLHITIG